MPRPVGTRPGPLNRPSMHTTSQLDKSLPQLSVKPPVLSQATTSVDGISGVQTLVRTATGAKGAGPQEDVTLSSYLQSADCLEFQHRLLAGTIVSLTHRKNIHAGKVFTGRTMGRKTMLCSGRSSSQDFDPQAKHHITRRSLHAHTLHRQHHASLIPTCVSRSPPSSAVW